ncbi:MAG: CDP-alcohol phosphatidyltransferase family protein [Acidimicrobiia bacterium]
MEPGGDPRAKGADALTLGRVVIAALLVPVVWSGSLTAAALLLSVAWTSDFADGRLARSSDAETRLGDWDLAADTLVGLALVLGLVGLGVIAPLAGIGLAVILGVLFLVGNTAAGMLLQVLGYGPFLYLLWTDRPPAWWAPFLTALFIAIVDWERLVYINIPAFFRGLAGRFEGRRLS